MIVRARLLRLWCGAALCCGVLTLGGCTSSKIVFTRIASETPAQSGATVFLLRNRDRNISFTFPAGWKAVRVASLSHAEPGDDLIAHTSPRGAFAISALVPVFPKGGPADDDWEYGVLEELRASLASRSPAEYTWVGSTWTTVTGGPALQTTTVLQDGSRTRDTYFFHDDLLLTASFVAADEDFEGLWPIVAAALHDATFTR